MFDRAIISDAWFCANPDERCRYCGRFVLFAPASLGVDFCRGEHCVEGEIPGSARGTKAVLDVKFVRGVRFRVPLKIAA